MAIRSLHPAARELIIFLSNDLDKIWRRHFENTTEELLLIAAFFLDPKFLRPPHVEDWSRWRKRCFTWFRRAFAEGSGRRGWEPNKPYFSVIGSADVLVLGLPDLANLRIPLGKKQADAKPGSMFSFGSVRFLLFRFWFSVPFRFRKLPLNYNHYTSIIIAPLILMIYFLIVIYVELIYVYFYLLIYYHFL